MWLWTMISSYVDEGRDLARLALSSHQLLTACMPWLKFPQIRVPMGTIPGEAIILTGLGPPAETHFAECGDEHLPLYGAAFVTNHPTRMHRTDEEPSDHVDERSHLISITGSGLQYIGFEAISADRLRFPGIDEEECHFAVFKGPMKKVEGPRRIPLVWKNRNRLF